MAKRFTNDGLDPVKSLIMEKIAEHQLDLKALSERAGRNVTYLQQFVRKGVPKRLPKDVRDFLAVVLNVSPESLGEINQNLRPRDSAETGRRKESPLRQASPLNRERKADLLLLQDRVLNRGRLVAVFNCPGIISEAGVVDWSERPARFAGVGPLFAVWASDSVGRLRPGDLAFVHPGQPAGCNDAIVVTSGKQIVSLGEMVERTETSATVLTASGKTGFPLPKHQIMRVALAVFR